MMFLIRKLGSIGFTVVISVALIAILILSTSLESLHGTPFAQKVFYQTRWFDFLISLLWINIFCSTILKFPFKKEQTGFLITHIGILLLLAGALIMKTSGIEGQMSIYEGETADSITQEGYALAVTFPNQEASKFDLRQGEDQAVLTKERFNAAVPFCPLKPQSGAASGRALPKDAQRLSFHITGVIAHAFERMMVTPGHDNDALNHAVHAQVKSKQLGQDISSWLMEHDAANPSSNEMMAGPVKLALRQQKKAAPAQKPVLRILNKAGQEIAAIDVSGKDIPKSIPVGKTGLAIKELTFYPFATVANNKLANFPEGKRPNPAVSFNLVDAKGVATRQVKFAFFPDFESMHAKGAKGLDEVKIKFEAGEPQEAPDGFDGLRITLFYGANDTWSYEARLQDKVLSEGPIQAGQCLPSGWMDVEFCANEFLARAHVSYELEPDKDGQGPMAASITVPSVSGSDVYWVLENKYTPVHVPKGDINFSLVPQTIKLPFTLMLKAFRKVDYPGTMDAASYESDVVLSDAKERLSVERTISMNRPLMYNGYKVFQSSYMQAEGMGKGSVFTIAKNPGIPWIYLGSLIACIGAIIQFYVRREDA